MRLAWLMHAPLPHSAPHCFHSSRDSTWWNGSQDVCVDGEVAMLPPTDPHGLCQTGPEKKRTSQVKLEKPKERSLLINFGSWQVGNSITGRVWQPSTAPPTCRNNGGGTWHLWLEGWSTGRNWMGCGMEGWNRLTASRAPSLATNSQILTLFLQTHKSGSHF